MKSSITLIVLILLFLFSCKNAGDKKSVEVNNNDTSATKSSTTTKEPITNKGFIFSAIDSLNKYQGTDSLTYLNNQPFYVGKANGVDFGVIPINDNLYAVYNKSSKKWIKSDSLQISRIMDINTTDLSGDNYLDITITYNTSGPESSNHEELVLIFNKKKKQFRYNKHYDGCNVRFDPKRKLVEYAFWCSVNGTGAKKSIMKPMGDSLWPISTVTYDYDSHINASTVKFYKGTNEIPVRIMKGEMDKMSNVFDSALFLARDNVDKD